MNSNHLIKNKLTAIALYMERIKMQVQNTPQNAEVLEDIAEVEKILRDLQHKIET